MEYLEVDFQAAKFNKQVEQALSTLTFLERTILSMRRGITHPILSSEEIAALCHTTQKRVDDIEKKAVRKMQHPVRMRLLECLPDGLKQKFIGE